MMNLNKELTSELIKTTDALRKKYKALRNGREAFETQLEETFKPITNPLKELVEKSNEQQNYFETPVTKSKQNFDDDFATPAASISSITPKNYSATPKSKHFRESRQRVRDRYKARHLTDQIEDTAFDEISQKYLDLFLNESSAFDNIYGIHEKNGKWFIGDGEFKILGKNIQIKNKIYEGSNGLYELIFKKKPCQKIYNEKDLKIYKDILEDTNAYRRSHDSTKQVLGNRGSKYKEIISKLLTDTTTPVSHTGNGLMQLSKKEKDYIFWDDPNELVVRLRLLVASHQAGHNNHSNEIVSIIEELKESNIIE